MKKRIMILLFAGALLTGCSTLSPTWHHPTKTAQDFEVDRYDCQGIAEQRAYNRGGVRYSSNPFIVAKEIRNCLRISKGWQSE